MADNSSFITGAAKGAFVDALEGLPKWATEKTALKISGILQQQVKALNALLKAGGASGASGMNAQDAAKFESELDKFLKTIAANNKEEEKALKLAKDREKADKKALFGVKEFDNKWQKAAFVIDGLAVVGKKVLDADKQYLKTYDAMYKSGINVLAGQTQFSDGFSALNHVVTQTGLRLETLQEISQKYASSINAVGFMKFAKAAGMAASNLKDMGFSAKDSAEMVGVYTDMQSNYTDMRGKSEQDLADGASAFGMAVRDNAHALGKSREEIIANAKSLSKSTDTFVSTAVLGANASAHMNNTLMGINPEFASVLSKSAALASQNLEYSSDNLVRSLATSGSRYTMQFDQLVKALPIESMEQIHARAGAIANDPAFKKAVADQALYASRGVAGAAEQLKAMQAVTELANKTSTATNKQKDDADKTASAITSLETQMEKFSAATQAAFSPTIDQVNILTKSMTLLNDAIYGVINATNSEARSWVGAGAIVLGQLASVALAIGSFKTIINLARAGTAAAGTAAAGTAAAGTAAAGTAAAGTAAAGTAAAGTAAGVSAATMAAAAAAAGAAGYLLSDKFLKPYIDEKIQQNTGVKDNTLGSWIYDMTHKDSDISILKSPVQSTINSPSAVPAKPNEPEKNQPASTTPNTPASPSMDKSKAGPDINSILTAQTNLLEQIRLASVKSVEVNENILKYTRNRT